ncbi:MAG: cyclic pyranopterin monophosphate synthase MoaC [Acidobacteriota bacterium]|nr:cyclic pyranopterin monophosphate synthase MoaC [Acidobacteriota bacterium]MDE3093854.1 cyclic pyranopterin monophosphate synthase MoaC [Acidobacteriota bacterium]
MTRQEFTHLDGDGRIHMVDISAKEPSHRVARASCLITGVADPQSARDDERGREPTFALSPSDILAARLTGIHAAKRTSDVIPLCHPLALSSVRVDVESHPRGVAVSSEVVTTGRTGVEMEALTACAYAALALVATLGVDDPGVRVEDLTLLRKSGGKSGDWGRESPSVPERNDPRGTDSP